MLSSLLSCSPADSGRQCVTAEGIRHGITCCAAACRMSARSVLAYAAEIPGNSRCTELQLHRLAQT